MELHLSRFTKGPDPVDASGPGGPHHLVHGRYVGLFKVDEPDTVRWTNLDACELGFESCGAVLDGFLEGWRWGLVGR